MNNKMLYVCYASSDYYARETGISMLGFFDNNPDYEPDVLFILDYGILPPNKEKLDSIAYSYGKHIDYLPAKTILEDIQRKLDLKDFRGSLATYSRAFIDKIMPEYVERLLYIDSDTVVVGSVSELRNFEMGDAVMAGCLANLECEKIAKGKYQLYSGNHIYITCGIVLFDLANWRKANCYQLMAVILRKKKRLPTADQTLINNAVPEKLLKVLPRKFNYASHFYHPKQEAKWLLSGNFLTKEEVEEAINHPAIIHFFGGAVNRPWYENCKSRRAADYLKYKIMSPWKDTPLYSFKDYKESLKGFHQKFGYWILQQQINRRSYYLVREIIDTRNAISNVCRRILKKPAPPSEGIEVVDNK